MKAFKFSRLGLPYMITIFTLITASFLITAFYHKNINRGIDFNPGVTIQFVIDSKDKSAEISVVRKMFEDYKIELQEVDNGNSAIFEYRVRVQQVSIADDLKEEDMTKLEKLAYQSKNNSLSFEKIVEQEFVSILQNNFGADSIEIRAVQSVSPSHASLLTMSFVWLIIAVLMLILIYIWFRFKFAFAIAAIFALIHDILLMVGFIGVFQIEITASTIAAILTILGYSLNDTIVIFDRIRENIGNNVDNLPLKKLVDFSITQSLSRTIVTSLTTLFTVVCLYIFAKGEIKNFALNLMVGIIGGTCSSIFVAAPIFVLFVQARNRKSKKEAAKTFNKKIAENRGDVGAIAVDEKGEIEIPKIERKLKRKKRKN